jgi:hypothetical protein
MKQMLSLGASYIIFSATSLSSFSKGLWEMSAADFFRKVFILMGGTCGPVKYVQTVSEDPIGVCRILPTILFQYQPLGIDIAPQYPAYIDYPRFFGFKKFKFDITL